MIRDIEPTVIRDELRGHQVAGPISVPNSGVGLLFSNGRVLDLRNQTLLSEAASLDVVTAARRVLERHAAHLDALNFTAEYPATEAESWKDAIVDSLDLEVPSFIPRLPVTDATPCERDEARQRRKTIIDLEEWDV